MRTTMICHYLVVLVGLLSASTETDMIKPAGPLCACLYSMFKNRCVNTRASTASYSAHLRLEQFAENNRCDTNRDTKPSKVQKMSTRQRQRGTH